MTTARQIRLDTMRRRAQEADARLRSSGDDHGADVLSAITRSASEGARSATGAAEANRILKGEGGET
jgi:hypothetical protein